MKRAFIILLALACLCLSTGATWQTILGGRVESAGGYTLIYDTIAAGGGAWPIGDSVAGAHNYAGLLNFSDASALTIGKVAFKLTKAAGDISGKTFTAKIWSLSTTTLTTVLATSDAVTGDNAWSDTTVEFVFSAPYTTTGSTNYAITIEMSGGLDVSNYAQAFNVTPSSIPGDLAWWEYTLGINNSFGTYDIMIAIYTTP